MVAGPLGEPGPVPFGWRPGARTSPCWGAPIGWGWSPAGPAALLVRPDGYLAWAAAGNAENPWSGAGEALRHWFGVDLGPNFTVTQSDEPVTRVGG